MTRSIPLTAALLVALGSVSVPAPAEAHGWRGHHHHHGWRHRHLRVHSYAPRHWVSVPALWNWGFGCHYRHFVTRYGTLAYREVCH